VQVEQDEQARRVKWEEDYNKQRNFEETTRLIQNGKWFKATKLRKVWLNNMDGVSQSSRSG
jgi:hypothetical protein